MSLADEFWHKHKDHSCLVSECSRKKEEKCDLPLGDKERFICVDAQQCPDFENRKQPDFVILDRVEPQWVVVEMKSRTVKRGDTIAKFNATVDVLTTDWKFALSSVERLIPVVLHKGIRTQDYLALSNQQVIFKNKKYRIRTYRCGTPLTQILFRVRREEK